jgi:type IV secretory pathway TrbD component
MEDTTIPIHSSLIQPILVAGAEREYTILIGFMAVIIWVAGKSVLAFGLAIAIWVIGMFIGRIMTKKDPYGFKILLRHVKYREYYPATEKLDCHIKEIKSFEI